MGCEGDAFGIWITGLPASGKSKLAGALKSQLAARGVHAAVLESDALRPVLTPEARYDEAERDLFYRQIAGIGALLAEQGIPVIFDATANRRRYREEARRRIPRFLEVYVNTPLNVCVARDPKGIYRRASANAANTVPGMQAAYEEPEQPDVIIPGAEETPDAGAARIVAKLKEKQFLSRRGEQIETGCEGLELPGQR